MLGAPALASATDITVNDDATGSGPASANCAAPDHATITAALAAAAASGDRILVCAGTYTQPQVLIDKSLDLIGAGAGQSIIDGGDAAMPSAGLIRTNDNTNGDVLVQNFTVQNVGAAGGTSVAILPKGNDLGTTQDFNRIEVIGEGVGGADYGIDAGSFTYLKHLPMTELKIDIEFVRGVVANPDDRRVVESIIAIARSFGMRTVAEGVEDAETLAVLESLGVHLVQGYLLGRPAPIDGEEDPTPAGSPAVESRNGRPTPVAGTRGAVVASLFEAISAGSRERALDLIAPEVVWTPTAWSGARSFHGREGVETWMDQFGPDLALLDIEPIAIEE